MIPNKRLPEAGGNHEWYPYLCLMNIDRAKTLAFTGHRSFKLKRQDLFGCSAESEIAESIKDQVRKLYSEGFRCCLCGMAEGFDLLAGGCVLELKQELPDLRLVAVVPFRGHENSRNPLYRAIIERCDSVRTVAEWYAPDVFHRRNDFLIDNSSAVIAYYNGSPGGTRYTVRDALKKGLRVINLYDL